MRMAPGNTDTPHSNQLAGSAQTPASMSVMNVAGAGLTVIGPVSGIQYHFARPGVQVQVDPRDVAMSAELQQLRLMR
jgi:hypothetical protein